MEYDIEEAVQWLSNDLFCAGDDKRGGVVSLALFATKHRKPKSEQHFFFVIHPQPLSEDTTILHFPSASPFLPSQDAPLASWG
jgi:hypothetical protein